MTFDNVKVCLITDEQQRFYYTDFLSSDGFVILQEEKTTLIVDSRYLYEAQQVLDGKGVDVVLGSNLSFLKEILDANNIKQVGIDYSVTTLTQLEWFKKALEGVEFINVGDKIADDMIVKTDEELYRLKVACEIAEKSYYEVLPLLKEGVTEREIANELEYRFKKNGASGKSFDTIIGFGSNSAVPHHETGDTALKKGDVVLMDFGCVYKGYCSDMTRTCVFGKASDEFKDAYNAVLEAHLNALNNIKAGTTGVEADAFARDVLKKHGRDDVFTHSLGHGIGLHIHELPNLSPRSSHVINDGMVYSNEPGVYYDGKFGIRIEDSCYMKDGITHSFMSDDKRLIEL